MRGSGATCCSSPTRRSRCGSRRSTARTSGWTAAHRRRSEELGAAWSRRRTHTTRRTHMTKLSKAAMSSLARIVAERGAEGLTVDDLEDGLEDLVEAFRANGLDMFAEDNRRTGLRTYRMSGSLGAVVA